MAKRKFNPLGQTCIKCEFSIPLTPNDHTLVYVIGVDHLLSDPPETIARNNSWQGRENCALRSQDPFPNKTGHYLLFCPRCHFIDELVCIDFPTQDL